MNFAQIEVFPYNAGAIVVKHHLNVLCAICRVRKRDQLGAPVVQYVAAQAVAAPPVLVGGRYVHLSNGISGAVDQGEVRSASVGSHGCHQGGGTHGACQKHRVEKLAHGEKLRVTLKELQIIPMCDPATVPGFFFCGARARWLT